VNGPVEVRTGGREEGFWGFTQIANSG
jgi:hypothetical protein